LTSSRARTQTPTSSLRDLSDALFEFARERDDAPVRLISSLRFPVIGELRGRNGIGKSLSIKLLQLLTGHQPWAQEEEAWRTLRDRLGPTSVTASGLTGAKIIEWDLNPAAWSIEPPTDVEELFSTGEHGVGIEARIDGERASLGDVGRLLKVHRLVGDETLEDSVRAQIGQIEVRARRETAALQKTAAGVRGVLVEAREMLEPLSGRVVRRLSETLDKLSAQRDVVANQVRELRERVSRLTSLETRARSLHRLEELQAGHAAEELDAKLRDIDAEIAEVTADRDKRFDAAVADVALRQRIREAREEVERVEALLQRAVADVRRRASEAQLDDEAVQAEPETVTEAHDDVVREVKRLRDEQARRDAVPLVRRAATNVKRALDRVDPPTLLDHPFAIVDERPLTGRQLADGVDAELRALSNVQRDPSAEELEQEIAAVSRRLEAITELRRALARQRRHTTALHNRRVELLALSDQAGGGADEQYRRIEERLAQLEDQRRELQGDRFRYSILLDDLGPGETPARARERLRQDLLEAGVVAEDDLPTARAASETSLREAEFQLRELDVEIDEARRALESARERQELGVEALQHTALVRALERDGLAVPTRPGAEKLEDFAEELLRATEAVMQRLDALTREAEGVAGAFTYIEREQLADVDQSRVERVRAAAERQVVEALNQPVLRRELFDHGDVEHYDHLRKTVSFRPAQATSPVTRSLSAFSSGER
jgi:chromosome segregation ATPase